MFKSPGAYNGKRREAKQQFYLRMLGAINSYLVAHPTNPK